MASGTPSSIPKGVTLDPEVASIPARTPPGVTLDDAPVSRSIGQPAKSQEPGMIDQLAGLSVPPKNWSDVASKAKTVLHVVPYVAAAAGPEGVAAGAAVQGLAGAAEEFGVQSIDKMNGKRQEYDWPAIGWNAGFNSAFSLLGGAIGKGISWITGAGSVAKDASTALTPKSARLAEQGAKDEVEAKTALDSLGTRLGMNEEQSAKMVGAYDEGRQVGDAVFKADRTVQGEFGKRYDKILKPVANDPVDMEPIRDSVDKSLKWLKDTGNEGHVRPGILKQIQGIVPEQVGGQTLVSTTGEKVVLTPDGRYVPLTDAIPTVTTLRGKVSELSALERTKNLTDVEESVIAQTRRALTRSISGALQAKDPKAALESRQNRRRLRSVQIELPHILAGVEGQEIALRSQRRDLRPTRQAPRFLALRAVRC